MGLPEGHGTSPAPGLSGHAQFVTAHFLVIHRCIDEKKYELLIF
jgi:hypothetical protein